MMTECSQQNGAADFSDDAGRFTGLEFVEAAWVLAIFIAEGEMVEQVSAVKCLWRPASQRPAGQHP